MPYFTLLSLMKLLGIPHERAWNESMHQYQIGRIATDALPDSQGCHLTLIAYKLSFCRAEDTQQVPLLSSSRLTYLIPLEYDHRIDYRRCNIK